MELKGNQHFMEFWKDQTMEGILVISSVFITLETFLEFSVIQLLIIVILIIKLDQGKEIGIMGFNGFWKKMEQKGYFCHFQKVRTFVKVL